jgi:hypothetical protein
MHERKQGLKRNQNVFEFNNASNRYNQQVETVGDKYMAVSGLPDECENHAVCIARLALDMIEMADNVKMGNQPIVSRTFSIISLRFPMFVLQLLRFPLAFPSGSQSEFTVVKW